MVLNIKGTDTKMYEELSIFIDDIETNEQFIVDYLKSVVWNYNKKVDEALDNYWNEYDLLIRDLGK